MDIEFLLERLERTLLEDSQKVLGNRVVNEEEIRNQLAQIRQAVPEVISEARRVVRDHDAVLDRARQEAEAIVAAARSEGERITNDHQYVIDARRQANLIQKNARQDAIKLRNDADEYAFDVLSMLQGEMHRQLRVVEAGLERLEASRDLPDTDVINASDD